MSTTITAMSYATTKGSDLSKRRRSIKNRYFVSAVYAYKIREDILLQDDRMRVD
jgi:hypothetical protein